MAHFVSFHCLKWLEKMVAATENYSDYCFFVPFYNLELIIKLGLKIKRESEKIKFEYLNFKTISRQATD